MPKKTKADLEQELENLLKLYNQQLDRNFTLKDQIEFLKRYSAAGHMHHLTEAMAKISHALRKTLELEKTGKTSSF